jgi:hypothetical protein
MLTPQLIENFERATLRKGRDGLLRAAQLPSNPYGVAMLERTDLLAYSVSGVPNLPWYNTVVGVSESNLEHLDEALALYASAATAPTVVTWATQLTPRVGAALFDRGFTPRGVGTTLYAAAQASDFAVAPGIKVHRLAADEGIPEFNTVLLEAYGFTHPIQRALAVLENDSQGVRRYLATVDEQPAAVAALTTHDGIAYLAGAATLERWRGRGAQTALIAARLVDAAGSSQWITVTTAFASRSQTNLERMGFRIAQLKTMWGRRSQF